MNRNPMDETDEITEDADYVNAPVPAVDKEAAPPDQRRLFFTRSLPLIAVCWLILLLIMGLRIHYTSVISEHDPKLTAENQNLREQNQNLREQNQQLEVNWDELNISRAQWSIDAYCPKEDNVRQCTACLKGWHLTNSSCYVTRNAPPPETITWEIARENCRGDNADLAVVQNEEEKDIINRHSWDVSGGIGYWIGLRVEEGKWKWIDGTELNQTSWIGPPTEGHCAVSVQEQEWTSVLCDDRKRWICTQKALTI